MKVQDYYRLVELSRRSVLKGTAAAALTATGVAGGYSKPARADDAAALRKQILQIPGVGKGSPTDADWQKVGEL